MNIEKEIEIIKDRNKKVENDKAWETSWTRRISVASMTYVIALFWLIIINESIPFLKACVPTGGYLLSTLSLSFVKKRWENKNNKK
ncbi:MAG: hypothetical protein US30_C0004G0107 [Candidatus Moranbacteria bacterium GW2011_GWF2_36_839]|nr:MAG: hypothetical protein US27_C0002G0110 [Candidatus Moranbacteria bacterium GW2011_GWF1_36_78]KKQ17363.1 MAG: hypothetical protein US30_C0004G0107 [Candidatus Moranbacteria bacterium GW2011_GWF2_36_839]HAT73794.1 hypothetical protein [Candidatus Moranbacteria bacterium]HBY11063.1 hypothetical protein [Candidatus Moranbacteria bacterium]